MKAKILLLFLCAAASVFAQDTVKIMAYNILNYDYTDTSRHSFFRTVVQNSNPDILVVEEIISQNAVNYFRDRVMNTIGIGTFSAGVFINGPDSDNGIFFKSSKFTFLANTPIHTELRDISEFKVVHISSGDTLRIYAVHLKANNTTADQQQRAREVDSLRKVTNMLPLNSNFIVLGDFNFYSANELAYQKLLQIIPGNEGHFIDMLNLTGSWNNQSYALHHTQSPRVRQFGGGATGGMDDRFDLILYSKGVNEPGVVTIIPQSLTAYGNDGNHYNDSINRPPNNAVGQFIADALHYGSDHLPVYAMFRFESPIGIKPVSSEVPGDFKLYQNYPNPFNPVTTIRFDVAKASQIKISVYDIVGREAGIVFEGFLAPGTYSADFDGSDLSSGIFFCKLTSEGFSETKKMIIVK